MALQDILDAISAEADRQIAAARAAHQKELANIREESARATTRKKQDIAMQKEQKLEQMRRKAEIHAESTHRNALLRTKRAMLDRLYGDVIAALGSAPELHVEQLLRDLLKNIDTKGEIRATKTHAALIKRLAPSEQFTMGPEIEGAGGFLFLSEKREHDCRFASLVESVLRPATELSVTLKLFGSSAHSA